MFWFDVGVSVHTFRIKILATIQARSPRLKYAYRKRLEENERIKEFDEGLAHPPT